MKKRNRFMMIITSLVLTFALVLGGCGSAGSGAAQNNTAAQAGSGEAAAAEQTLSSAAAADSEAGKATSAATSAAASASAAATSAAADLFTERDLAQTADLSAAKSVTLSDGQTLSITEAGVYVLSGSAQNACVVINAGDEDKVQLVLDGVSMTNTNQPCILVENADKVFLTSAEGSENSMTVSGAFSGEEDAVVFSRDDLVLNGLGTVNIISSYDGVRSNDDLKLTGGSWNIEASNISLKAHEGIYANDGVYILNAGDDGLHAENNDDNSTGEIRIDGGSFTIKAGDDGVHATTFLTVNGGSLDINAGEGLEATQVVLNNGSVNIQATDDGINAGQKSTALSIKLEINGGEIKIAMGAGDTDALDSNGDLSITGGRIEITAQSPFDYDGNGSLTGGTVIVNGTEVNSLTNQMMGGPMGGQFWGQPGGQMGGQPGGQMGGQMGGQPGGQTGGQPGGQPGGGRR